MILETLTGMISAAVGAAVLGGGATAAAPVAGGSVDRRRRLSYQEFARDYMYANRPVVITDALEKWKAVGRWTPEFFKENFGTMPVKFEGKDQNLTTMASFIDRVLASTEDNPAPYFRNQILYQMFPSLKDEIQPLPEYVQPNWLPDRFLVKQFGASMNRAAEIELYIGGRGGRFPILHYDHAATHAFLMQVYGRKEFILYSPAQDQFLYPNPQKKNLSQITDLENPDLAKFPLFAQARATKLILEPGEMLFIPSRWWHTTVMLTPCISISANSVNASNWAALVEYSAWRCQNPVKALACRAYLNSAGVLRSYRDRKQWSVAGE